MKYKLFLRSVVFGLLIASPFTGMIYGMDPNQERLIIAEALKPGIFYSKYFPLTLAAYAATGLAINQFKDSNNYLLHLLVVTPVLYFPALGYEIKKSPRLAKAKKMAENNNNVGLVARLNSFSQKYANFFAAVNFTFPLGFMWYSLRASSDLKMSTKDKFILLGGSLIGNILLDRWATKEENIPQ